MSFTVYKTPCGTGDPSFCGVDPTYNYCMQAVGPFQWQYPSDSEPYWYCVLTTINDGLSGFGLWPDLIGITGPCDITIAAQTIKFRGPTVASQPDDPRGTYSPVATVFNPNPDWFLFTGAGVIVSQDAGSLVVS